MTRTKKIDGAATKSVKSQATSIDARKLQRVRARIANGYYDRPEVLRDLVDILLPVLERPGTDPSPSRD
ncbi:MAG: hypothetical protein CME06_16140 [Gemmatimonadetes bacterium]|nr:hypothetical protein [Gemmatimonadota bacterium]